MLNQSLLQLETEIWNSLEKATQDPKSSYRTVSFSTTGADNIPESRMVILRNASKDLKILEIFTDARSNKYQEILRNPKVSLLFYEPFKQIQIRIKGKAEIHNLDKVSLAVYNDLSQLGRRLYGLEYAPGIPGEMDIQGKARYNEEDSKKNFSLIRIKSLEMDYLELANPIHRRAIIQYYEFEKYTSNWVMP